MYPPCPARKNVLQPAKKPRFCAGSGGEMFYNSKGQVVEIKARVQNPPIPPPPNDFNYLYHILQSMFYKFVLSPFFKAPFGQVLWLTGTRV
jgi:hypothetical protein